jgi:hypothetical protein
VNLRNLRIDNLVLILGYFGNRAYGSAAPVKMPREKPRAFLLSQGLVSRYALQP